MSEDLHPLPSVPAPRDADRRAHPRQIVRSLAYVELGDRNGGIILNLSEGGMTVKAAMGLTETEIPRVRFQLTQTQKSIETRGRISWTGGAKKTAGLQFIDLPDQALSDIREWIRLESSSTTLPAAALPAPAPRPPQPKPREAANRGQSNGQSNGQATAEVSRQALGQAKENVAQEEKVDERAVEEAIDRALRAVKRSAKAKHDAPVMDKQELDSAASVPTAERPTNGVTDLAANRAAENVTDLPPDVSTAADPSTIIPSVPPPGGTSRVSHPISIPFSGHFGALPPSRQAKAPSFGDISSAETTQGLPSQAARSWSRPSAPPVDAGFQMPKYAPPTIPRGSAWSGRTLIFLGIFCFLAVGSLLAGWIAGRGTLTEVYARITGKNLSEDSGGPGGDSAPADGNSGVSQIEILDVNNNRRMIPLSGPISGSTNTNSAPNGLGSGSAPAGSSRATHNIGTENRDFVPLPDLRTPLNRDAFASPKSSGDDASAAGRAGENAPDLQSSGSGAENARPPSLPPTRPSPQPESQAAPLQSTVPTEALPAQRAELLHWVEPTYPPEALDQGVQGTVRLHVVVGTDGGVKSVQPLSGAPLLVPAAVEAVRQWRYRPTLADGMPVETTSDVSLVFTIPAAKPR